jgi:hypothetical protein
MTANLPLTREMKVFLGVLERQVNYVQTQRSLTTKDGGHLAIFGPIQLGQIPVTNLYMEAEKCNLSLTLTLTGEERGLLIQVIQDRKGKCKKWCRANKHALHGCAVVLVVLFLIAWYYKLIV